MILWLMKHSRPDIANSSRELIKDIGGITTAAFKEMLHVIKCEVDTKDKGLKLEPTCAKCVLWELICCIDSD